MYCVTGITYLFFFQLQTNQLNKTNNSSTLFMKYMAITLFASVYVEWNPAL